MLSRLNSEYQLSMLVLVKKVEDLQKFDSDTFVNALFDVEIDDEDEDQK